MNGQAFALVNDIRALGVCAGDTLLIHSSLRSLGRLERGAQSVIEAFLEVLGGQGTLLMPALTYEYATPQNPVFSSKDTKACVGALPEAFRAYPGTVRSLHPTHSVCANGKDAKALTESHIKDTTPVGPNSPFRLLRENGGKILMLGCGLRPNTSMHGVEELVVPPYLFLENQTEYILIDEHDRLLRKSYTCHDFKGVEQRYDRIEPLLAPDEIKKGTILDAVCYLIDARALWQKGEEQLKKDPLFFVDQQ